MKGPEYLRDEELLRRSVAGEEELQRAMRELEQSVCGWQFWASGLERERHETTESATANRIAAVREGAMAPRKVVAAR